MQKKNCRREIKFEIQESREIETNDSFPGGKKAKLIDISTENNNNHKVRASKFRHNIRNIGLNKKNRKN